MPPERLLSATFSGLTTSIFLDGNVWSALSAVEWDTFNTIGEDASFFFFKKGPFDIGNQATGVRNWSSLVRLASSLQNLRNCFHDFWMNSTLKERQYQKSPSTSRKSKKYLDYIDPHQITKKTISELSWDGTLPESNTSRIFHGSVLKGNEASEATINFPKIC